MLRHMRTVAYPLLAALLLVAFACDDRKSPEAIEQAAAKARSAEVTATHRPTTQELISGAKKRIPLTPLPFTARVPTEWKIETLAGGSIIVLTGPTPSSDAQIQLSTRPQAKKAELEYIQRGAKKETDEHKSTLKKAVFRSLGDIQILDRQVLGQPGPITITDDKGNEHIESATPYTWTLSFFVPRGENFDRYELNFLGLTLDQYEADKQLLTQVVDSLAFDPAAVPATQP